MKCTSVELIESWPLYMGSRWHVRWALWSPEFSESVDCRSIDHQLVATCKINKKTTVVFHRPSDGKVSLFLEDFKLEQQLSRSRISYLVWCDLLLFYGRRKEDPSFLESRRFLPIMLGKGGSYFGKDDLFCLLRNYLPDKAATRNAFLFSWRRADRLMGNLILIP